MILLVDKKDYGMEIDPTENRGNFADLSREERLSLEIGAALIRDQVKTSAATRISHALQSKRLYSVRHALTVGSEFIYRPYSYRSNGIGVRSQGYIDRAMAAMGFEDDWVETPTATQNAAVCPSLHDVTSLAVGVVSDYSVGEILDLSVPVRQKLFFSYLDVVTKTEYVSSRPARAFEQRLEAFRDEFQRAQQ